MLAAFGPVAGIPIKAGQLHGLIIRICLHICSVFFFGIADLTLSGFDCSYQLKRYMLLLELILNVKITI